MQTAAEIFHRILFIDTPIVKRKENIGFGSVHNFFEMM